jgi:hypothetical protein
MYRAVVSQIFPLKVSNTPPHRLPETAVSMEDELGMRAKSIPFSNGQASKRVILQYLYRK